MSTAAVRSNYKNVLDVPKRDDLPRLEDFLQSLARAVRQFHTYPATSPRCVEALDASHRALPAVELERIVCVVSPHALLIEGTMRGTGTLVEHELARRLYDARILTIDLDRTASRRDLEIFCTHLVAVDAAGSLADRLREHGVDRIAVGVSYRPEVMPLEASPAACLAIEQERRRRDAQPAPGRATHLFPPDKGWLRVDPGIPVGPVSLHDLALLVEDPLTLASMLSRVAGDASEAALAPGDALEQRFGDVTTLLTSLDPHIARARFARLASTVLALHPPQRRRLLSSTVLPGLVDGRPEGNVMNAFPDVDLADALSLLLDVETAAPELLTSALDRLHLSEERRRSLAPLLEDRIKLDATSRAGKDRAYDAALAERTHQLIRVAAGDARTFEGFAAFDLSVDDETAVTLAHEAKAIAESDVPAAQLLCLSQLLAANPNPEMAERFLGHVTRLLGELEAANRLDDLATWLHVLRDQIEALRRPRPDVAAAITSAMERFFVPARVHRLIAMHEAGGEQRSTANELVAAAGASLTTPLLAALQVSGNAGAGRAILEFMRAHAASFAPAIVAALPDLPTSGRIMALRALGAAGRGLEPQIARELTHAHDAVVSEALRALARIGSRDAANLVAGHVHNGATSTSAIAEEALWQFSPEIIRSCLRTLLGTRQLARTRPDRALRLLDRAASSQTAGLDDVFAPLTSLRFRLWNPQLARIGWKARALVRA
jgi:hypothetical protein